MPVPLIVMGGVAAVSIGSTVHSTLKSRKWKKIHDEALESCKATDSGWLPWGWFSWSTRNPSHPRGSER